MQQELLTVLNWRCEIPTARHWLYPLWLTSGYTSHGWRNDVCNLSRYIAELGLLSTEITSLVPSLQAASALYYARSVVLETKGYLSPCILQQQDGNKENNHPDKENSNTIYSSNTTDIIKSLLPYSHDNQGLWPVELHIIVNHSINDIIRTAVMYQELSHRKYGHPDSNLKAIYNKYAGTAYGRVAEKYCNKLQSINLTRIKTMPEANDSEPLSSSELPLVVPSFPLTPTIKTSIPLQEREVNDQGITNKISKVDTVSNNLSGTKKQPRNKTKDNYRK